MTVRDWCDMMTFVSQQPKLYPHLAGRFLTESGRVRTPSSVKSYRDKLRSLQQMYPNKGITQFSPKDLTDFCLAGNVAPATVNAKRSIVTTFFSWAKHNGLVKVDPATDLKWTVQPGKYTVRQNTWLSTEQIKTLLKAMPTETLKQRRDRVLVYTGLFTGLRLEGLVGLHWSSFTPDLRTVRLTTKGQKMVELSVPDNLRQVLKQWHGELAQHQIPDGPLFFRFWNDPLTEQFEPYYHLPLQAQGARHAIAKAGKLLGVELRPHDLRRSFANMLEEMGFDVKDISRLLFHENIATTSNYLDKNPHRAIEAGKRIVLDL